MDKKGYNINLVEMQGHTPPNCGQKGVFFCTLLRRGAVSPQNVPETKQKMVSVLCMGCGRNASASELNLRQVGARASTSR